MKILLKQIKRKSVYIVMAIMVTSTMLYRCSEDNVLDLQPFNQPSEDVAFSSPELIELSVTGMYNAAQRGDYNGAQRGYPFGAAFVQQGDNRGEDAVNIATFYQLTYTATYDPTTANNVYYWSDTYRLINRANLVIEGVTNAISAGIITQEVGDDYIGQAKFFRAAAHLELLFHFARPYNHTTGASHPGVPFRNFALNTEERIRQGLEQGRNTVAETYQLILDDLNDAESKLPSKSERSGVLGLIRATSESAIAIKTRAYLHMGNWDMVITEGSKLNGIYSLTSTPDGPFSNGYANSESIFSIEHTATNNPGVNAALASQYNRRLLVAISPIIWRNPYWLSDDLRREEVTMVTTSNGVKYTNKYKDPVNYTDPAPVIRYAEVLLSMAEAYARKDDLSTSLNYLNMVRNRSLANPATQAYVIADFANKTELLQAIIAEKRIEFVLEGRRWPDIHRLQGDAFIPTSGIPAKVANGAPPVADYTLGAAYTGPYGVDAIPYDDYRFLWPIPQQEVNTNPTLAAQQNPGW